MKNCIIDRLQAWLTDKDPPILENIVRKPSLTLIQEYKHQTPMGWIHLMNGQISIHWSTLGNSDPYQKNNMDENTIELRNYSKETWGSGLLYELWKNPMESLWIVTVGKTT